MKKFGSRLLFLFLLLVPTWGCNKKDGGSSDPIPSPQIILIAGKWTGTFASSIVSSTPISLSLSQTTTLVTGSFDINNGAGSGNLSGSVAGDIFTFTASQSIPCVAVFNGSATINKNKMNATFTGTDCFGPITNGIAILNKS